MSRRKRAADGNVGAVLCERRIAGRAEARPRCGAAGFGDGAAPGSAGIGAEAGAGPPEVETAQRVRRARHAGLGFRDGARAASRQGRYSARPEGSGVVSHGGLTSARPFRVRARGRVAEGCGLRRRVGRRTARVSKRQAAVQRRRHRGRIEPLSRETLDEHVDETRIVAVFAVEFVQAEDAAGRTRLRGRCRTSGATRKERRVGLVSGAIVRLRSRVGQEIDAPLTRAFEGVRSGVRRNAARSSAGDCGRRNDRGEDRLPYAAYRASIP